jgi:hypothetical protein
MNTGQGSTRHPHLHVNKSLPVASNRPIMTLPTRPYQRARGRRAWRARRTSMSVGCGQSCPATAEAGPFRILLIEDDPRVAETLAELLELEGFRVAVVEEAEAGLARAGRAAASGALRPYPSRRSGRARLRPSLPRRCGAARIAPGRGVRVLPSGGSPAGHRVRLRRADRQADRAGEHPRRVQGGPDTA